MYLRFVTDGYSTNYEMYGAQSESLVGLYDAMRSAILEVTAEAVVVKKSSEGALLGMKDSPEMFGYDTLENQIKAATSYAHKKTEVFIADTEQGPGTLFYTFPAGLYSLAAEIATKTVSLAKYMQNSFQMSSDILSRLDELDREFYPQMLHKPLAVVPG